MPETSNEETSHASNTEPPEAARNPHWLEAEESTDCINQGQIRPEVLPYIILQGPTFGHAANQQ
jgi:hypothetical protein